MDIIKIETALGEIEVAIDLLQGEVKKIREALKEGRIQPKKRPKKKRRKKRRKKRDSYEVLILEALEELSGQGTTDEVSDIVERKKNDYEDSFDNKSVLARRAGMVRNGWLEYDKDEDLWKITDGGRDQLTMWLDG